MTLETAIAQTHATREASADERNVDNVWMRADFVRQAPGLDWPAFFAAAGLSRQPSFVVWQPGAVKGAAALVAITSGFDVARLSALSRHSRACRGAAARFCRAGPGASGLRNARPAQLERPTCDGGDSAGDERDSRATLRRAIFPGRTEGTRASHHGQRDRGFPAPRRSGDVVVARQQETGAGQAEDALLRCGLPGEMARQRGPHRQSRRCRGEPRNVLRIETIALRLHASANRSMSPNG